MSCGISIAFCVSVDICDIHDSVIIDNIFALWDFSIANQWQPIVEKCKGMTKKNWNKVRSEFEMVVKIGQQCAEAAMNFFVILLVALEFCKWTWTLKWTRHQNQMPRFVHSVALKFFVFFPICSVYFIKYVFCFNWTFIWKEKWKRKVFFVPWEQKNVQFDSIHFKSDKSAKKVKKLLTCQSGSFCLFCLNAISDYKSLFVYYTLFKGNRKKKQRKSCQTNETDSCVHLCDIVTYAMYICTGFSGIKTKHAHNGINCVRFRFETEQKNHCIKIDKNRIFLLLNLFQAIVCCLYTQRIEHNACLLAWAKNQIKFKQQHKRE